MQIINGVELKEPIPKEINSKQGNLIILGCGRSVWDDYFKASAFFRRRHIEQEYEVMCVNDIVVHFKVEPVQHMVSIHSDLINPLLYIGNKRNKRGVITHSITKGNGVDIVWGINDTSGTSSCVAVKIALLLGYRKIVLCGVPMDNSGHYYDPKDSNKNKSSMFEKSSFEPWVKMVQNDKIKSISGRTKELFGEPTRGWVWQ
jgi:hypothetical protein